MSFVALLAGALLTAPLPAAPKDGDPATGPLVESARTFTEVAKSATPSVVFIEVEKSVAAPAELQRGFGSFGSNDPSEMFGDDLMRRFFGDRGLTIPRSKQGGGSPFGGVGGGIHRG